MRKLVVILLMPVLPVLGGVGGHFSAPLLSKMHYVVRLADQVRLEEADAAVAPTLESDAFRATGREPEALYADAGDIEEQFALGAVIFGVWCGGVIALRLFGLNRTRRRVIYEINYDTCLACGRCFLSCPRERQRLEERKGKRTQEGVPK